MAKEIVLTHPRTQIFYRFISTFYSGICLGSRTWWGFEEHNVLFKIHSALIFTMAPIVFVSQLAYAYVNRGHLSFSILGTMCCLIPLNINVNVVVICCRLKNYRKVMSDFMERIHLYNHVDGNERVKKICWQVEKNTRYMTFALGSLTLSDWALSNYVPIRNNIVNIELIRNHTEVIQTSLYLLIPINYDYDFNAWYFVQSCNVYLSLIGVSVYTTFNSINTMFTFHLIGHIQALRVKLKTEFKGIMTDEEAKIKICGVIQYHAFIMRIFSDVQDAFGVNVTLNYLHNLAEDSLLLYQIMFGDETYRVMYAVMVVIYMGTLLIISLIFEEIRRKSEDLPDMVYDIPWENMSINNQKLIMMLLARLQPGFVFVAAGGLRAGIWPTITIFKSTFSYYLMLKTKI